MMEHDRLADTFGYADDENNEQSEEFEDGYEEEAEEEEVEVEVEVEVEEEEEDMEAVNEEGNFVDGTSKTELVQEVPNQEQDEPQEEQDENLIKEEEDEQNTVMEKQFEEDLREAEVEEASIGGEATKVISNEEEVEEELIEELRQGKCMEELTEVHSEEEFHQEKFRELTNKITLGQDCRRGKSLLTMAKSSSKNSNKECQSEQNHSFSSENKGKTDVEQVLAQKKGKKETSSEASSDSDTICTYRHDATKCIRDFHVNNFAYEHEKSGSSGKKRCSRWDQSETGLYDDNIQVAKRRKTRWDIDDKQIKMLGPLQLPDFTVKLNVEGMCDVEIQKLNKQLIEINNRLLDAVGPENGTSSPSPICKELGIQIDKRKEKLRSKLIKRKQEIIAKLIQKNLLPTTPKENKAPPRHHKKLYIPAKEFPGYNFIGLILGPCGSNQKRMEMESGAKILLRGKGSVKEGNNVVKHTDYDDELHVRIEADNQESLDAAVSMVGKLLVPVVEEQNELKRAQLQELARIKGKSRSYISCVICGDTGHSTSSCPLTAPTGESRIDRNSTSFLGEIGGGELPSFGISSDNEPAVSSFSSNSTVINKEMDAANLFVGYLPQSIDETGLAQLFSSFGTIISVKVIRNHATGASKGYGFVRYDDPVSAVKAVEQMNRFQIGGKTLVVRVAGRPPSGTHHSSISPTLNPVGRLPVYPGPPSIPQSLPEMTALTRPSLSFPGSSSVFPQDDGFFTQAQHLTAPPASYASCTAPAIPRDSTDIFTPAEFANFAGNPDHFTSQFLPLRPNTQNTWFSNMVSGNRVPPEAANCLSKADYPTSMYDFHQPNASLAPYGIPSPVEAAYFPGNPDYIRNPFYQ